MMRCGSAAQASSCCASSSASSRQRRSAATHRAMVCCGAEVLGLVGGTRRPQRPGNFGRCRYMHTSPARRTRETEEILKFRVFAELPPSSRAPSTLPTSPRAAQQRWVTAALRTSAG
eukprot:scaffold73027_cov42-Phaeocystis_antarctica.AAC.2